MRRPRRETENGTGAQERRKKREEEVEAEFGGVSEEPIGNQRLPGSNCHYPDRNTLQIPQRVQGGVRHKLADSLLVSAERPNAGGTSLGDKGTLDVHELPANELSYLFRCGLIAWWIVRSGEQPYDGPEPEPIPAHDQTHPPHSASDQAVEWLVFKHAFADSRNSRFSGKCGWEHRRSSLP